MTKKKIKITKFIFMALIIVAVGNMVACSGSDPNINSDIGVNQSVVTGSAIRFEPGKFGPGMYGVNDKFTSWEDLEKKGDLWVENHKLSTNVSEETGENSTENSIIGAIIFPDGITEIGNQVFSSCEIFYVSIPDSVGKIGDEAFGYCGYLDNIDLPEKLTSIGKRTFADSGIEYINIPDRVKQIGAEAFAECNKLKEVDFPDELENIEQGVLRDCESLTRVKLPKKLKSMKASLIENCKSLRELEIPARVRTVDMSAFAGTSLSEIVLPKNVKAIENTNKDTKVFNGSDGDDHPTKNLRVIEIRSMKLEKIQKNSFSGLPAKVVIKVPSDKRKEYTKMLYKSGLSKKIKIDTL